MRFYKHTHSLSLFLCSLWCPTASVLHICSSIMYLLMMCEIQTSLPRSKFSPLHAAFPSDTRTTHIHPPLRSLEACTNLSSHFHRASFQEIRLISFFLVSVSLCMLWLDAGSAMTVCIRVSDMVVAQQVVKLIITSSNHTHVWWNWSRPASFSSGPKTGL